MGGVVGLPYDQPPQLEEITYTATVIGNVAPEAMERMHQAVEATCPCSTRCAFPPQMTRCT